MKKFMRLLIAILILTMIFAVSAFTACGDDGTKTDPPVVTPSDPENPDEPGEPDDPGESDEPFGPEDRGESGPVLTGDPYPVPSVQGAPEPYGPVPSASQMKYYEQGLSMFIHFGINTFTGAEWGDGSENPKDFNPSDLDTDQWISVAKEMGFGRVILTAKHHDGFVLYPTEYTDHSVASSDWKDGKGDVLQEFFDSCEKYGMDAGIYLSPWDRNMPSYSVNVDPDYNDTYVGMLEEIFERYGNDDYSNIVEFWLDGACGEPETRPTYDYARWWETMYGYNEDIVIKSEYGSTVHWVGNYEADLGAGGDQAWQTFNKEYMWAGFPDKKPSTSEFNKYINNGVPYVEGATGKNDANIWSVGEADISIRTTGSGETGAWFWDTTDKTRTPENLAEIYFRSVGRGGVFLLNVPPTNEGKFEQCDIDALAAFREILDNTFGVDKADGAAASADVTRDGGAFAASNVTDDDYDTYWTTNDGVNSGTVTVEFDAPVYADVIELQEYIPLGQRIKSFDVDVRVDEQWLDYGDGTTVGYKRLVQGVPMNINAVRVTVDAYDVPLINHIGVYKADQRIEEKAAFSAPGTINASEFDSATLNAKAQTKGGRPTVGSIKDGARLSYEKVLFNGTPEFVSVAYAGNGEPAGEDTTVTVRLDDPSSGPVIATCKLEPTGSYYKFADSENFPVSYDGNISGYHTVWLTITGGTGNSSKNAGINLASVTFGMKNTVNIKDTEIFVNADSESFAEITLTRPSTDTSDTLDVTLNTSDGSGKAGTDYTALKNYKVTFAAGENEKTVRVDINAPSGSSALYDFTVSVTDIGSGGYLGAEVSAEVTVVSLGQKENYSIGESATPSGVIKVSGSKTESGGVSTTTFSISNASESGAGKTFSVANGSGDGFRTTGKKQVVYLTVENKSENNAIVRYYLGSDDDLTGVTVEIPAGESVNAYFSVNETSSSEGIASSVLICANMPDTSLAFTGYVIN